MDLSLILALKGWIDAVVFLITKIRVLGLQYYCTVNQVLEQI